MVLELYSIHLACKFCENLSVSTFQKQMTCAPCPRSGMLLSDARLKINALNITTSERKKGLLLKEVFRELF